MSTLGQEAAQNAAPSLAVIILGSAFGYAALAWVALQLPLASGIASPVYPAAGFALAVVLVYGSPGAIGACLGSLMVNLILNAGREPVPGWPVLTQPLVTAIGTGLQAALGAWLVRRSIGSSLALAIPGEVAKAGWWGGVVACLLNASLSVAVLSFMGATSGHAAAFTWLTWWVGDTLGVLIGAPIVLSFIGQPRAAWRMRRVSVALPMAIATLMLGAAYMLFQHWEQERQRKVFEAAAEAVTRSTQGLLDDALGALQAVHDGIVSAPRADARLLRSLSGWWLQHVPGLQAIGLSERVARSELAAFEAQIQAEGGVAYRTFDRPGNAQLVQGDSHSVVVRAVEPLAGNEGALGVNALSVPAAREAILASAQTLKAASTRTFRLSQSPPGVISGAVVYRALEARPGADPASGPNEWRGVVFVTVILEPLLSRSVAQSALPDMGWCLLEHGGPQGAEARVVAKSGDCTPNALAPGRISSLALADRRWELRLDAPAPTFGFGSSAYAWLLSTLGLVATSVLGLLLLTVTGRARRIEAAVKERTQALSIEVRERREAVQALGDSRQRLRSILDHLPLGVVFLDAQGRLLDCNPGMARLLDRSVEQCTGLAFADLFHPDEQWSRLQPWLDMLEGRTPRAQQTLRLLRSDGSSVTVRATVSALRDGSARPTRLVGVVEDITEHLRLDEIERARDSALAASRAKSEFVSRMSHELRTPLNAMLGFAQLLSMDNRPALVGHQALWTSQIQSAGWHLLELINDTLDLSRIEAGAIQLDCKALDLDSLVQAVMSLMGPAAAARRVSITLLPGDASLMVLADATRTRQVLSNLLSNSIKYNREGGRVELKLQRGKSGEARISVRDTGLGMSPQQLGSLFQAYNRLGREHSSIEGTGIGLAISQRLATAMGGTLLASSTDGEGSVFTLTLPLSRDGSAESSQEPIEAPAAASASPHALHYIEDNETNVLLMRGMLAQRASLSLTVSTTGLEGLATVRRQLPDLVLLDMQLPDIDGMDLLRELKADDRTAGIPVLVVSADASPQRVEQALTLGAARYITKPIELAALLQAIDEVMGGLDSRWT